MLYFRVLLEGLGDLPPSDPSVREEILAQAELLGWPALHKELMTVDPETASALHPNHSQRIQRALEIYRLTGLPPSRIKRQTEGGIQPITNKYEVIQLALTPQHRQLLHRRIAERFQRMLEQGFVDEVKGLRTRPDLHPDLPAIRAVGYRQVWDHLAGNDDYQTMVNKGVAATRQLAKRQLTWLRRWPSLTEVSIDTEQGEAKSLEEIVSNCLKILQNGPIY